MAKRGQNGFTLVELLVCIVVGSIVTLAATTVLLLGLRINNQSTGTVTRQNTTRVLLTALEDIATEGNISIEMKYNQWRIFDGATTFFSYDATKKAIYTGDAADDKEPLLDGVLSSGLEWDDRLLTISVTTEEGTYQSSVYCRAAVTPTGDSGLPDEEAEELNKDEDTIIAEGKGDTTNGRKAFLEVLASQYRTALNTPNYYGRIIGYESEYEYYSQWYIKGGWGQNGWGPETPWCACYVTWAIHQTIAENDGVLNYSNDVTKGLPNIPSYAGVDSFMGFFTQSNTDQSGWLWSQAIVEKYPNASPGVYDADDPDTWSVQPGDIVFFDWEQTALLNVDPDPDHVGVVLHVDQDAGIVYTIEGNTSNMVAVRQYYINDPRILGYGVLAWNTAYQDLSAVPEM